MNPHFSPKRFGPPPKPTRVFVEFEVEPRTAFGLGDGVTQIQSASDSVLRERLEVEAVNEAFQVAEFECTLKDDILTISTTLQGSDLFHAVDIASAFVHDLLIAAGLGLNLTFSAKYRRAWGEDGSRVGRTPWASHSFAQWDTAHVARDFQSGAEWLSRSDASFRSGLLFFRRATWVYEVATGSIRGNWESYSQAVKETGWAAAIAIMLLWKAVISVSSEDTATRRVRLSELGFNEESVAEFERFRDSRNRVTHDEWEGKDPKELNNAYGQLRELTRKLLIRKGQLLSSGAPGLP
ncbi:MAG TPA: hypothetical protein VFF67_04425 [Thermoplasmata archaeon]|nr:hypothetical protein [Thermoplasmata archaeon]